MRRLVLVGLFVVAACGSMRSRADDLYKEGRFLEAAELYDRLVRENPNDAELKQRRTRARNGALRVQLAYVTKVRTGGHAELAAMQLGKLLALRDGWQMRSEPAIASLLATEVTANGTWMSTHVRNRARTAGPLVAENIAMHFVELLATDDLAPYRETIQLDIASAARDACARLAPTAITPYWTWLASRYCAHFNTRPIEIPRLPNLRTGLAVTGSVTGTASGELDRMRAALTAAFRESVWYAPDSGPTLHASLSGSIASTFSSNATTKSAEYTEEIPYTDFETQQESYQEPYDDTEYYTEQVPQTEYRTETYSCGDSTCTRTVPETVYRSESRTRTVTKYRTAYRSVTVPVTKYRTEYRTYTYAAVDRAGHYTSQLRLVFGSELDGLIAASDQNLTEEGTDHDAEFSPAGISPQRANLTTAEGFVAAEERRLAADLGARLAALYAARYCTATTYSLEEAARCAYLDPQTAPPSARGMLRAQFGEDEALLALVLARS